MNLNSLAFLKFKIVYFFVTHLDSQFDSIIKGEVEILENINNQKWSQFYNKNFIISGLINLLILLYYIVFITDGLENLYFIYNLINPFTIAPIIVGLFSLYNLIKNKSIIMSAISFSLFVFSVLLSLVAIMGIQYFIELLIYLPSLIITTIHFVILVRRILKY